MITVMGATGHTGGAVVARLLVAGAKVRAVGRSADRLARLRSACAEVAVGDPSDPAFLSEALPELGFACGLGTLSLLEGERHVTSPRRRLPSGSPYATLTR